MEFDAILLPPRRAASIAQGLWADRTVNDELDACLAECPDKTALTALHADGTPGRRLSYRALAQLADRMAEVDAGRIPILRRGASDEESTVVGLVARRDLLRVRAEVIRHERDREKLIRLRA